MPPIDRDRSEGEGEGSARIRSLFDRIASRYDLLNDLQSLGLHRRLKRRLVERALAGGGRRVLDVCCGTGDVALALAAAGAEATGLDFSPRMVELARRRPGAERVREFVVGDALALPFPPESFDAVTISFGLRNLTDIPAALEEMIRVLKPEGRLLILEFGKPPSALWRFLWYQWLRSVPPLLGRLFGGEAAAWRYILSSLERYPGQEGVGRLLESRLEGPVQLSNLAGGAISLQCARRKARPESASGGCRP